MRQLSSVECFVLSVLRQAPYIKRSWLSVTCRASCVEQYISSVLRQAFDV